MKKKVYYILLGVIVLAFIAGNLVYPKYINNSIDYLNKSFSLSLPHFWNVPFILGLDLQGGVHLVYEADLSSVDPSNYTTAMQGLRDIIERRINIFGVQEPIVQVQESANIHRLVVELAGVKDPNQAINLIGQTPFLEFKKQRSEEDTQKILDKQKEVNGLKIEDAQKVVDWELALQDPYFESTELTGKYLDPKKTDLGFDQNTQKPLILLQFNEEGARLFEQLTADNVGKKLAIYIDGVMLSAPNVQEKISGGSAQITGEFTLKEAKDLVKNLKAGALPVPIKLVSQQVVGPTLGVTSLQKSLVAGLYGFIAIIILMVVYYRLPGLLASIALLLYVVVVLAIFKLMSATLTLAGIGGFILSIGMAVDANVLIFSRIREELREKKGFSIALEEGFKRSWPSIRDGNFTTLLVALILFWFGTSFIKGFALTLSIGILVSMFSAIVVTRNLMRLFSGTRLEKLKWLW